MLSQINFPKSKEYKSGSPDEPISFFLDVLPESKEFDILLGYFSSSALHVLSLGFATFIHNGGKVRMAINHILSLRDKKALIKGKEKNEDDFDFSPENMKEIKDALDEYGIHFFNCLAWLIASKKLVIKVIKPVLNKGIAHYKSGVFRDGLNKVKFKSSCNFTSYGLLENLEELDIKTSWSSESEQYSIDKYEKDFCDIFFNRVNFLRHVDFDDIEEAIFTEFGGKDINELLVDEVRLAKKKAEKIKHPSVNERILKLEKQIRAITNAPSFPHENPRDYQKQAYYEWCENNFKGIFAMATGTGKTLTALNCVLEEFHKTNAYRAIILVPTIELVLQWKEEIESFKFTNIILVSSKNKNWRNELNRVISLSKYNSGYCFFVVSTYDSFRNNRFQSAIEKLPKDTIFIADEAHNLGSPGLLPFLEEFNLVKRIGLSATPERVYDEEGSKQVDKFFEDSRPYTFEFSMSAALERKYLCPYFYYPIIVELNDAELEKYIEISNKLAKCYDTEDGNISEITKKLLLIRKQIIHKASNKIKAFEELIKKLNAEANLKKTLVYAPEGYFDEEHFSIESNLVDFSIENNRVCEFYANRIREFCPDTKIALFNSDTANRKYILQEFENETIDVLVSMKCLDEGVDIPKTDKAIFCASTGNPRQFIQRRGRILRKSNGKRKAVAYDMIVVPSMRLSVGNSRIEKSLVLNELKRVREFISLSENKYEAVERIDGIIKLYNIKDAF